MFITKNIYSWIYCSYVAFALFGYIFISGFSSILFPGGTSSPLAILLRIIIVVASLIFSLKNITKSNAASQNVVSKNAFVFFALYVLFWVYYFFRILFYSNNELIPNEIVDGYLLLGIFLCFIPTLGMNRAIGTSDLRLIIYISFWVIFIGLALSMYFAVNSFILGESQEHSRLSLERLSPIQVGKYSAFLCLLSIGLLSFKKNTFSQKTIYLVAFVFAIVSIFLSGSRTAFLGILAVLFINSFFTFSFQTVLMLFVILPCSAFISSVILADIIPGLDLFSRYTAMGGSHDESALTRFKLYYGAWEQFSNNPIFGDFLLERKFMYAPHNLYLEIIMSMGVIGGGIFLTLLLYSLYKVLACIYLSSGDSKKVLLVFFNIYVYLLVSANFSLGITTGAEIWSVMVIFIFLSMAKVKVSVKAD